MLGYTDLGDLPENKRIEVIGNMVMTAPQISHDRPFVAGIALEDQAKADRYAEKLKKRFPQIRIIETVPGLVPGTVLLRVGKALQ
ncbi:MAG: hypothetical protein SFX19_10055 [Alphaproteobacteria bacterium]|nr:hypothetical protein [Alphaproteobacteria bacterium]